MVPNPIDDNRAGSRFASSQWETSLQSNAVSHWLGASLKSAMSGMSTMVQVMNGLSQPESMMPSFVMPYILRHQATICCKCVITSVRSYDGLHRRWRCIHALSPTDAMMTSSNENIFRVTGLLCGEFTGHRWIPHTKASGVELWRSLWSASE